MAEPNDDLRHAQERTESPNATGHPLSRQELAELVNAWVYEHTTPPKILATDANYLGQLERGRIRWPQGPDRRAGFRAVLNVATDTELALVRSDRLTATERSVLHTDRSRALAKLGQVQDALTAVGLADEEFSHSRPAHDPATVRYFDAGVHAGETGRALWDLAVHHGQFLTEARHRLSTTATSLMEDARGHVMDQIKIASLVMVAGDPDEAVLIGRRALDVATPSDHTAPRTSCASYASSAGHTSSMPGWLSSSIASAQPW